MFEKPKNQPKEIKEQKIEKTPPSPGSGAESPLNHYYLTLPVKLENGPKYLEKFEVWAKSQEELWELVIDKLAEVYGEKKVDADFNKALIHTLESGEKPKKSMIKRSEPVEYAFETPKENEGRYLTSVRFIIEDEKGAEKEDYLQFETFGKTKAEAEQKALEELYKRYPGAKVTQIYINAFDNPTTPKNLELEGFPIKAISKEQIEKEKTDIAKRATAKQEAIGKAIKRKEEMERNQRGINFSKGRKKKK